MRLVLLNKEMQRIDGNYKDEIRSVNFQFAAFMVGYVLKTAVSMTYLIKGEEEHHAIYYLIARFFSQMLPILIVLALHVKAFNPRTITQREKKVFEDQDI